MQNVSPAELLASLPAAVRDKELASLDEATRAYLMYHWPFWARPNQIAPTGDWITWAVIAGRGFGKTRIGTEWVRSVVCGKTPLAKGSARRLAIVGETAADVRDVLVEGDSGILAVHPRAWRPTYEPSKRRLTWPNGAVATLYNGTEPDQLRGPQHDAALVDELAKYDYARETWDMLQFGLRLGDHPRQIVTTTPRPIPVLKEILRADSTVITRGSTAENASNLAPTFLAKIVQRYEGTRLGRQELDGEILDDLPGALWTHDQIADRRLSQPPALKRIVVSIDPSGTKGKASDKNNDVGIIVAGKGVDNRAYVLSDRTCNLGPTGWGERAIAAYRSYSANCIVAEVNFGGAMVEAVIRSIAPTVAFKSVTASRGKVARAEPIAALYEQGRVSHCGIFKELEDQMCLMATDGYAGDGSPDRVDALVWALTELMLGDGTFNLDAV